MTPLETLTARADTVLERAASMTTSHPWAVVTALHEIARSAFPSDPFITFDPRQGPVDRMTTTLNHAEAYLEAAAHLGSYAPDLDRVAGADDLRDATGSVYGKLWSRFPQTELVDGARDIIAERFRLNGFDPAQLQGTRALDMGCGSGRFTLALRQLGAAHVTGVDWGDEGLELAETTRREAGIDQVEFRKTDILKLPFEDASFDFVFCNGVLHHTTDLERGLAEFVRVARPGARMWLYLYGSGGIFWHLRKTMPPVMKAIPQAYTQGFLEWLGMPRHRFIFADNWYVPIERHCSDDEVRGLLEDLGVAEVERCTKSLPTDLEQVALEGGDEGRLMWGEGELRYLLTR